MLDELATGQDSGGFWLWFWMAGILKENCVTQWAVHIKRVIRIIRQGLMRSVDSVMSTLRG